MVEAAGHDHDLDAGVEHLGGHEMTEVVQSEREEPAVAIGLIALSTAWLPAIQLDAEHQIWLKIVQPSPATSVTVRGRPRC